MMKILILTNGNYFSNIILKKVLSNYGNNIAAVFLVRPLHSSRKSFFARLAFLVRNCSPIYLFNKLLINTLFGIKGALFENKTQIGNICRHKKIPVKSIGNINAADTVREIREMNPDLILSVGCWQIISAEILGIPSRRALNVHASLLPAYAGMNQYFWVLANNEKKNGVTVHYMTEAPDAGDILLQSEIENIPGDSMAALYKRQCVVGQDLLAQAVEIIIAGQEGLYRRKQDLAKRSYFSFPGNADVARFYAKGKRFWRLKDLM